MTRRDALLEIANMKPTREQLASAALSYDHSFGLMNAEDQQTLIYQAKFWLNAWQHEFRALIAQEGQEQPPRFDEYGAYGENNPPVGAPSTREPTTPTLRWVWNVVPIKGHIGGPFVAEQVLQQCVRDADGNMIWQDVGENSLPVQGGTGE